MSVVEEDLVSLLNLAGGGAIERFDEELKRVLENIADVNTALGNRQIQLTVKIQPTDMKRNLCKVSFQCTSKILPSMSVQTQFYVTGLAEYLTVNPDGIDIEKVIVEVLNPTNVVVTSVPEPIWMRREKYLVASHVPKAFPCEKYLPLEEFIVALQAYFIQDDMTAVMLALLAGVTDDSSVKFSDDGISQQVTAKTGIVAIGQVTIPNPVNLSPYRTFLEVEQPSSKFVFRMQKSDKGPQCALFGADGNMWELEAIQRIRDWLRQNVPEAVTILA